MSSFSEARIWDGLRAVEDPDLGIDVVDLGLVYGVGIEGSRVTVTMTLTTMGCPAAEEIELRVRAAVSGVTGVEQVVVDWTFDPPWTPDRLTDEGRDMLIALGYL